MFAISTPSITPARVPTASALPGLVGVDVNLQRFGIADDEQRVPELLELLLDSVAVEVSPSIMKVVQ